MIGFDHHKSAMRAKIAYVSKQYDDAACLYGELVESLEQDDANKYLAFYFSALYFWADCYVCMNQPQKALSILTRNPQNWQHADFMITFPSTMLKANIFIKSQDLDEATCILLDVKSKLQQMYSAKNLDKNFYLNAILEVAFHLSQIYIAKHHEQQSIDELTSACAIVFAEMSPTEEELLDSLLPKAQMVLTELGQLCAKAEKALNNDNVQFSNLLVKLLEAHIKYNADLARTHAGVVWQFYNAHSSIPHALAVLKILLPLFPHLDTSPFKEQRRILELELEKLEIPYTAALLLQARVKKLDDACEQQLSAMSLDTKKGCKKEF